MDAYDAKKLICESGLKLVKEGLVSRTWGNISCRIDNDSFAITPSGRTYEEVSPEDVVIVNMHDLKHEGNIKPSSEKGMHAEAYKQRPDVNAVIHTHQMNASTVAAAQREIPGIKGPNATIVGSDIRVAAYALPGTKKLKIAAAKALEGRNAALLANHGAVCIGKDMEAAFIVAKTLEEVCQSFIESQFLEKHSEFQEFSVEVMHQVYLEKYSAR